MSEELKRMLSASVSPLTEISETSLEILFERVDSKLSAGMPESLSTTEDIEPLVNFFLSKRESFLAEQMAKSLKEPKQKTPKSKPKTITDTINLL